MSKSYIQIPAIHILSRSELADIEIPPADVISLVEDAYLAYAESIRLALWPLAAEG